MGSVYLGTGSVISSWLGEPGISINGVGVRQKKPVWSWGGRGAADRHVPAFGKWDVTVSAEAKKKLSVTALVQMHHQKACQ